MEKKPQSKKFLLIYTIALFSVALILVLASSVRHQEAADNAKNFEEQLKQQTTLTQGVQSDLEQLQKEYETMQQELDTTKEELETKTSENETLTTQNTYQDLLIQAADLYLNKNYSQAKNLLNQLDVELAKEGAPQLEGNMALLYKNLKNKLY